VASKPPHRSATAAAEDGATTNEAATNPAAAVTLQKAPVETGFVSLTFISSAFPFDSWILTKVDYGAAAGTALSAT
jgi:hypothetical protein